MLIGAGLAGCSSGPHPSRAPSGPPPPPPLVGSSLFSGGGLECRIEVAFGRRKGEDDDDEPAGRVPGHGRPRPRTTTDDDATPAPGLAAPVGPPTTIYVRFTNRGKERIEFEVMDFASQFGNFALQPDKLALAPGQRADAEPMSSQILNTSGDVAVKVTLRAAGNKETRTVALLPVGPG